MVCEKKRERKRAMEEREERRYERDRGKEKRIEERELDIKSYRLFADMVERFQLSIFLTIIVIQNLKDLNWEISEHFLWQHLSVVLAVLLSGMSSFQFSFFRFSSNFFRRVSGRCNQTRIYHQV